MSNWLLNYSSKRNNYFTTYPLKVKLANVYVYAYSSQIYKLLSHINTEYLYPYVMGVSHYSVSY